jgi:hypothetical protein
LDKNDLPGIDKGNPEKRKTGTKAHQKGNTVLADELDKATVSPVTAQVKSKYKKGDRIKNAGIVKKEGDIYFIRIKGQDQPAVLIGKPNYGASVVTVIVEEINNNGIVTKVRKVQ